MEIRQDELRKYEVVDTITGEILDNVAIMTYEERQKRKEYLQEQKKKEFSRMATEGENFVQYLFNEFKSFEDLSPQTAVRLMYLSTYLSYDENYLKTTKSILTRNDIQKLMILKDNTFKLFLKEVTQNKYLIKTKKGYVLNQKIFIKGKSKTLDDLSEQRYIRVYINAMRKLYITTKQNRHIYLGYIFQLIPYINMQWNIICHNPLEKIKDEVVPMTLGEFCEKIGYNKSNASRLIKIFKDIRFSWRGEDQLFCSYIYEPKKCNMRFFVNPNIFYAGDNFKEVEILGMFF